MSYSDFSRWSDACSGHPVVRSIQDYVRLAVVATALAGAAYVLGTNGWPEPDRTVEYALAFPEYKMKSTGVLRLEPAGKATRITWSNSGDVGATASEVAERSRGADSSA